MDETILVVGGGQAGGCAAQALRAGGFEGRVIIVGNESWRPYERPPLSKDVLLATDDTDCFKGWLHEATFYDDASVERIVANVTHLDTYRRVAVLGSGRELRYDRCLLATGGRARALAGVQHGPRVVSLRTLDDAMRLRSLMARAKSVAVVGGGFLGLEFAASARARGLEVVVFEAGARLLSKAMPAAFSGQLHAKHEAHGVRIVLDAGSVRIAESDSAVVVASAIGTSSFDFCVVAVGQEPNDEIARASRIDVSNGIVVDEYCRTSAPYVYAAGDCANFPLGAAARATRLESWQNAQEQGIAAARNMLGESYAYRPTPWFWTDQYDWNIQMLGMPNESVGRWIARPGAGDKTLLIGLRENVIVYALALNQGGELRALRRLVEQAVPVEPDQLADMSVKLRKLEQLAH
ncbi:NAD(P)/FAD-dependent oxidoreductase [Paraburkholderia pallida]|uniref:Pyridine nucleotide-disulfide oxidoreductase n=1 Tax=Paraburkholderia pallida TaxID=2547399 RepID=A0A4V1B032_9BURK|nr:FAD-dependent oxidoreductase [Paraburkholderia pallida]QBR01363.1 pyridine nucleotide-disulfide oxidoreductase [Paraburkholderia pallida]